MIVNEYTAERFTESEVKYINEVADVVCMVFKITKDDLKGSRRLRNFVDARKVLCHYICNNVRLENFQGKYHLALATWFLNVHHSTVNYHITMAGELYKTDFKFRSSYDLCVKIVNERENGFLSRNKDINMNAKWEDVRLDPSVSYQTKLASLPKRVANRIKEMYEMGYPNRRISYECKCTNGFINIYVKECGFDRMEPIRSIKSTAPRKFRVAIQRMSTKIDY